MDDLRSNIDPSPPPSMKIMEEKIKREKTKVDLLDSCSNILKS